MAAWPVRDSGRWWILPSLAWRCRCRSHRARCRLHRGRCRLHRGRCRSHRGRCRLHRGRCALQVSTTPTATTTMTTTCPTTTRTTVTGGAATAQKVSVVPPSLPMDWVVAVVVPNSLVKPFNNDKSVNGCRWWQPVTPLPALQPLAGWRAGAPRFSRSR